MKKVFPAFQVIAAVKCIYFPVFPAQIEKTVLFSVFPASVDTLVMQKFNTYIQTELYYFRETRRFGEFLLP